MKAGESCGVAGESSGLLRWFVEAMMGVWRVEGNFGAGDPIASSVR